MFHRKPGVRSPKKLFAENACEKSVASQPSVPLM
jgi:hypothetical protein